MGGQKGNADYTLQGEDELEEICAGARAGRPRHFHDAAGTKRPTGSTGIDEVGSHRCEGLGGEESEQR